MIVGSVFLSCLLACPQNLGNDCGGIVVPPDYRGHFERVVKYTNLHSSGVDDSDSEGNSSDWDWKYSKGYSVGSRSYARALVHVNDSLPGSRDSNSVEASGYGTINYSWEWGGDMAEPAPGGTLTGSITGGGSITGTGSASNSSSSGTSAGQVASISAIVACESRGVEGAQLNASGEAKGGQQGTVTVDAGAEISGSEAAGGSVDGAGNALSVVEGQLRASGHYRVVKSTLNQADGGYAFAYGWVQAEPVNESFSASNVQISISTSAVGSATAKANGTVPLLGADYAEAAVTSDVSSSFDGKVTPCVENPDSTSTPGL